MTVVDLQRRARKLATASIALAIISCWLATLSIVVSACSPKGQRSDTIRATITAVDAAANGLATWNREKSKQIVADAQAQIPTIGVDAAKELATRKLDEHDGRVNDVLELLRATYRAIALAAADKEERSLKESIKAASAFFDAVARVRSGGQ